MYIILAREPYDWFKKELKNYEVRQEKKRFNRNTITKNNKIIVQRTRMNEERFEGVIGKVERGTLQQIFKKLSFKKIIPIAKTKEDAIEKIKRAGYIKDTRKCIAFEIKILSKK